MNRFRWDHIAVYAGTGVVFLLDWITPLGVAIWLLYLPLVSASYWISGKRTLWFATSVGSVLLVVGGMLSPSGIDPSTAWVNRFVGLLLLWSMAGVLSLLKDRDRSQDALRESEAQFTGDLERRVREHAAELLQSQERLKVLTTELSLAEQHERQHLATELHDHLQQMLVLAKLKLGLVKRLKGLVPGAHTLIKNADDVLSDALVYTRTLTVELSPPILRDRGLPDALRWLGKYMKKHDLDVTVTVPEQGGMILPEAQAVLLFQSVRELLMNSWKHAGTGRASVSMYIHDSELQIQVSDKGKGFDLVAQATTGGISSKFGLFSIRERLKALGGSFDIRSAPGQGTTATLTLSSAPNGEGRVVGTEQTMNEAYALRAAQSSRHDRVQTKSTEPEDQESLPL